MSRKLDDLMTGRTTARRIPVFNWFSSCLGAIVMSLATGCSQNMDNQPRYEAYESTRLFANGTSARGLPMGTVPRPSSHEPITTGSAGTRSFPPLSQTDESGRSARSNELEGERPMNLTGQPFADMLERGAERYAIHCMPCHGSTGGEKGWCRSVDIPILPRSLIVNLRPSHWATL